MLYMCVCHNWIPFIIIRCLLVNYVRNYTTRNEIMVRSKLSLEGSYQ